MLTPDFEWKVLTATQSSQGQFVEKALTMTQTVNGHLITPNVSEAEKCALIFSLYCLKVFSGKRVIN